MGPFQPAGWPLNGPCGLPGIAAELLSFLAHQPECECHAGRGGSPAARALPSARRRTDGTTRRERGGPILWHLGLGVSPEGAGDGGTFRVEEFSGDEVVPVASGHRLMVLKPQVMKLAITLP
jgi:hypothetical protein